MTWEYRQWVVHTKGWIDLKLPDEYIEQLNHPARQGWEVDQMVPIHFGISGTSAVVFLREKARLLLSVHEDALQRGLGWEHLQLFP